MNPDYRYEALVTRVVDGDTIDAEVDLGFYTVARIRFRLANIDAPETYGVSKNSNEYRAGLVAKMWLADQVLNRNVIIESQKTGKYGRWLAVVYIDGVNVNETMIELCLARKYR